jgi:hypothetical protein
MACRGTQDNTGEEKKGMGFTCSQVATLIRCHSLLVAQLGRQQRLDDIAAQHLKPCGLRLAPVDVRPPGFAGAVDGSSRPELVVHLSHARLVFDANVRGVHDLALGVEQALERWPQVQPPLPVRRKRYFASWLLLLVGWFLVLFSILVLVVKKLWLM